MTVSELIEVLEQFEGSAEVRLATQPSWPLQAEVRGVAASEWFAPAEEFGDQQVVWIVEGDQPDDSPYAPSEVFANASAY